MRGIAAAMALVALLPCAACMPAYQAGTLAEASPSHDARRLGCLEVTADLTRDAIQPDARPRFAPLVRVALGNVCDHPADVHFENLHFLAEWPDGSRLAMTPYDPRRELRPARLDAWGSATEKLLLESGGARSEPPLAVCVDVSGLEGGERPVPLLCRPFAGPRVL